VGVGKRVCYWPGYITGAASGSGRYSVEKDRSAGASWRDGLGKRYLYLFLIKVKHGGKRLNTHVVDSARKESCERRALADNGEGVKIMNVAAGIELPEAASPGFAACTR
jgi:hypothetical protein